VEHAKKNLLVDLPQIPPRKLLQNGSIIALDVFCRPARSGAIHVHVDSTHCSIIPRGWRCSSRLKKQSSVHSTWPVSKRCKETGGFKMPGVCCLFESIESLVEMAHVAIIQTRRWLCTDCLRERALQEGPRSVE
jgi:hypothetical protein